MIGDYGVEFMQMNTMFQFAIANIQEMVLFFDETGRITFANKRACDLLEFDDIVEECTVADIFPAEFPMENGKLSGEYVFGDELHDMNAYRRNRTCFPVVAKILEVPGEEGHYCVMGYDATEQVYLKKRHERAQQEVEDALKVRSEFIANVTHELRTPVNGILGNTKILVEIEEDREKRKLLSLIERGCTDMNSIINNILDFSKLDAGKFTLEIREFNFRELIEYVQSMHKNKIYEKGLDFIVNVSPDIPEILVGDELRIVQILNNLLSNATKFTSVGRIVLEVVRTAQMNGRMELFFMVTDTGIGIDKAGQDKLFKSFSQVDASISRRFGGTGLGLNICKQLVELMGGNIQVESEPGRGSMFSFHIWVDLPGEHAQEMMDSESVSTANFSSFRSEDADRVWMFGTKENVDEIHKKMSKLILSVEMDNWEKAEMFMDTVRKLIESGPEDVRKAGLRLKMAVQKGDYDKTVKAFDTLKELMP